jgi:hypothetical protein
MWAWAHKTTFKYSPVLDAHRILNECRRSRSKTFYNQERDLMFSLRWRLRSSGLLVFWVVTPYRITTRRHNPEEHDLNFRTYTHTNESRGSSVGIALGCGLGGVLRFDSRQRLGIFFFTTASRTALEPTQPPIQWVPGGSFPGSKAAGAWSWPLTPI